MTWGVELALALTPGDLLWGVSRSSPTLSKIFAGLCNQGGRALEVTLTGLSNIVRTFKAIVINT